MTCPFAALGGWQTGGMNLHADLVRRTLAAALAGGLALGVAACSEEQSSADTTAVSSSSDATSTTTTVVDTTAASTTSSSTSTTSTSTSTTSTSSTTTLPEIKGLGLGAKGLGDATFGADADETIAYVTAILGSSTNDSGWVDPIEAGAACPGTRIRFVDWHDLSLFFTDESPAASGLPHFASYSYGPAVDGSSINPFGLTTKGGVGVGATVEFLRATYPAVRVDAGDDISGPSFLIQDGLMGFLTGSSNSDTIISFVGGYGCGE